MHISFVVPAYNESKNIKGCITSIQQELARNLCAGEIIVVNNASTDETKSIALSCGVQVVDESRKGIVWARKAGFEVSTGELIANIDADNRLPEGWLAVVLEHFQDKKLYALSGPLVYYDVPAYVRIATKLFLFGGLLVNSINSVFGKGSMLQGGNFVLRREAITAIGGFDTSISFYGEDTDIGRRVSEVGKVVWTFKLPILSSGRRILEEGLFRTGIVYALNFFSVTYGKKPAMKEYKDIRN